jgi:hypothetical protein
MVRRMFGWVKNAAKTVGNFVRGAGSFIVQGSKAGFNRFLGLGDFFGTLFKHMPEKQVFVEVLILQRNQVALAKMADVQAVLDLADDVYREQMNVRIVNRQGRRPLDHVEDVPARNLSVTCEPLKVFASNFSGVGAWFRDRQIVNTGGQTLGWGNPVTVFVTENVEGGNAGCCPGFLADYAVIDPGALSGSEAKRMLLAHEVGHACGLWHPAFSKKKNLMKHETDRRSRRLGRLQKAVFRSSGHVTRRYAGTIVE